MEIHENKEIDFFYMKYLIKIIDHCIQTNDPYKSAIHCTYTDVFRLRYIAEMINNLDKLIQRDTFRLIASHIKIILVTYIIFTF